MALIWPPLLLLVAAILSITIPYAYHESDVTFRSVLGNDKAFSFKCRHHEKFLMISPTEISRAIFIFLLITDRPTSNTLGESSSSLFKAHRRCPPGRASRERIESLLTLLCVNSNVLIIFILLFMSRRSRCH